MPYTNLKCVFKRPFEVIPTIFDCRHAPISPVASATLHNSLCPMACIAPMASCPAAHALRPAPSRRHRWCCPDGSGPPTSHARSTAVPVTDRWERRWQAGLGGHGRGPPSRVYPNPCPLLPAGPSLHFPVIPPSFRYGFGGDRPFSRHSGTCVLDFLAGDFGVFVCIRAHFPR